MYTMTCKDEINPSMSALETPHIPNISLTTCLYVNCLQELSGVVKLQYKNQYKHERLEAAIIQFKMLSKHPLSSN
jgi:hypothetical protein